MYTEYKKWFSQNLHHDMEVKVYGHWGMPMLVFPCAGGTFHEFEDFGMIDVVRPFIEAGKIKVFTVGSIDHQTWLNQHGHPSDRARRHNDYDRYIIQEVVPFIYTHLQSPTPIMTVGCSLGGMHSLNFHLRHPDVISHSISLSGIYTVKYLVGEYFDDNVYYNSPLDYLPNLDEDWFLSRLRHARIVLCCGQGAWDGESLQDSRRMAEIFKAKGIPAWVDIWGHDAAHDWPWWKKQLPYFLDRLL